MHTLNEQRQEGNHEHQEDTDDATMNPVEYGRQVVAAVHARQNSTSGSILTYQD
jgi:hypothetical protein